MSKGSDWLDEIKQLEEKEKTVGLTQEEKDRLEFMQYKWDDWASDGEFSF